MTTLGPATPFLIVSDLTRSLDFYTGIGFETRFTAPEPAPFFAIIGKDQAQLMLKQIGPDAKPMPNNTQHNWAPWDAYIHCPDPDAFAATVKATPALRDDGLYGFEVTDPDGYTLFFGRPEELAS